MTDIGAVLARIEKRLAAVERASRLSSASLDDTALEVRDSTGGLRGIVGQQADGTTAVNFVNGPPPPAPSPPVVVSVLGGVSVAWDGTFADGAAAPLDWQRVEVHASTSAGFTPVPATLMATIETPQGATVIVPTDVDVYVRLVARSTSGTASDPTAQVGPYGPTEVVATDLLDGIVTEVKLANDAVTAAKLAAAAVSPEALAPVLADTVSQRWTDLLDDPAAWTTVNIGTGAAWDHVTLSGAPSGGKVGQATGFVSVRGTNLIPHDPNTLYRISVRVRATAQPPAGAETIYVGLMGFAADKTTMVNRTGANAISSHFYAVASNRSLPSADGWQVWTGFVQGRGAPATSVSGAEATDPLAPALLHDQVRYMAPYLRFNFTHQDAAGIMQVDSVTVEALRTGVVTAAYLAAGSVSTSKLVAGAVQTAQLDTGAVNADKIASGAVTTAKLDALAVTADKIAANAITAEKIVAGAVTATALSATAIDGKTITGAVLQTAASGERITINEAAANKVIVYDDTGRAVGELSGAGLLLEGTNGALIHVDPDATYPRINLTNDAQTNQAYIAVTEPVAGAANLNLNSGPFTASSFSDMKWRTYFGADFWIAERTRESDHGFRLGGRVFLDGTSARFGYTDSGDSTQNADIEFTAAFGKISSRLQILPTVATSNSAVLVQTATGHTGHLLRLYDTDAAAYKFSVDLAGNATAAGVLTAGSIATGRTGITPSAANTPTSLNVTGLNVKGTTFRVVATPSTSAPGTQVTGVGVTNVTSTGFTLWLTRTNTTSTAIDWIVIGS